MRVAFAGTPAFAAASLQALVEAKFEVVLVLTQPDRPAGRGLRELPSTVKQVALAGGLRVEQPATLRDEAALAMLRASGAPVLVVAAYGLILPQPVLDAFPLGCVNIHASLLPRWRGAAPIQRAILAGDRETGISIMRMEKGLDTGPVYAASALPILAEDSAGSLHDRLAALGAKCIVDILPRIADGRAQPVPQPEDGVTYAHKIEKREAGIDWHRDAAEIGRQVRAFDPFPGAFTALGAEGVKIWRGNACAGEYGEPGRILQAGPTGLRVACGSGGFDVAQLQKAGGKRLSAAEFLRGAALTPDARFGA
ncbi:MAG TPA: methionyl-tRNA formyltransferase [Burkholderiales bacterium]|nr:methionyl-tRNA formyltransferase [Burkholderiales bacterium]